MIHNLWGGLAPLGTFSGILYLVVGALIGMFMGVIPGIGGPVVLSIMLSVVYHINIDGTLCLFLGTYAGSYFSASVTSILLNTPAHPEAFAVTLDGFPMARRGEAGRALGLSATATCVGGLVGCGVLLGFLQVINYLPNLFHPPEYVGLVVLAILLVGTLGTDSVAKAIISMGIGLAIASVGPSTITGTTRYAFGNANLYGGISLVSLTLGLFAIPQMVMVFGTKTAIAAQDMTGRTVSTTDAIELERGFGRQAVGGVVEALRHWRYLILGGLVGSVTGLVPGVGGFAANFMSYGVAQQVSKNGDKFGTGVPEGVVAPEASSLSKEAGSMIPIIGLGIPGSVGGALLLAALTVKGLRTGYGFATAYPTLPYEMLWIIAFAGIIGTIAGLLAVPLLAKVTRVPGPVLVLFIFAFAVIGSYLADISYFACAEVFVFGLIGLVLRRLRYSLGAFVLGLILGPTLEVNVHLTHSIYPGVSFLTARPLADVIFAISLLVLVLKIRQMRRLNAATATATAEPAALPATAGETFPVLALATSTALLVFSIWFTVFGITQYNLTTALLPAFSGILIALPAAFRIPIDVRALSRARRERTGPEIGPPIGAGTNLDRPTSPTKTAPSGVPVGTSVGEPGETPTALLPERPVFVGPVAPDAGRRPWGRGGQYRRELYAFAWLGGLLIACDLVGFKWAVSGYCLLYGLTCTRQYFRTRTFLVIFSVTVAVLMWFATRELFILSHVAFDSKFGT